MDRQPKQGTQTVCIAVPPYLFDLEFGAMLCDVFSHLGFRPMVVHDEDQAALAADVLLLIGTGLHFTDYARLLNSWQGPRPTTILILWQSESLPTQTKQAVRQSATCCILAEMRTKEASSATLEEIVHF